MCNDKVFSPSGTFGLKEKQDRENEKRLKRALESSQVPPPPEPKAEQAQARRRLTQPLSDLQKRLAASRGGTLITGPLGLTDDARIGRKMLLGQ